MPSDSDRLFDDPGVTTRLMLDVGDGHCINVEVSGHGPNYVISCHGGPGGQIDPFVRRLANPDDVTLVQFDQRGCGLSTPRGETKSNTLPHTLEDMETIRKALGIDKWVVTGGSWGATVALAYAQSYHEHVVGVIVRGAFLSDPEGFEWFDFTVRQIFPDVFEEFAQATGAGPSASVYDTVEAIFQKGDRANMERAALALTLYEEKSASFNPPDNLPEFDASLCVDGIKIALHYRSNNGFLSPKGVLLNIDRIANLPGIIVHGRYDIVCPVGNAHRLHAVWPGSKLILCDQSGHLTSEPLITAAMVRSLEALCTL